MLSCCLILLILFIKNNNTTINNGANKYFRKNVMSNFMLCLFEGSKLYMRIVSQSTTSQNKVHSSLKDILHFDTATRQDEKVKYGL